MQGVVVWGGSSYLPANALLMHVMQQQIHHQNLPSQGSYVQGGLSC